MLDADEAHENPGKGMRRMRTWGRGRTTAGARWRDPASGWSQARGRSTNSCCTRTMRHRASIERASEAQEASMGDRDVGWDQVVAVLGCCVQRNAEVARYGDKDEPPPLHMGEDPRRWAELNMKGRSAKTVWERQQSASKGKEIFLGSKAHPGNRWGIKRTALQQGRALCKGVVRAEGVEVARDSRERN